MRYSKRQEKNEQLPRYTDTNTGRDKRILSVTTGLSTGAAYAYQKQSSFPSRTFLIDETGVRRRTREKLASSVLSAE